MSDEDPFLGREIHQQRQFSEHTMQIIDDEVARILRQADELSLEMLTKYRHELELITQGLLKNEELDHDEIEALIGPSVHGAPPKIEEDDQNAEAAEASEESEESETQPDATETSDEKAADELDSNPAASPSAEKEVEVKTDEPQNENTTAARLE